MTRSIPLAAALAALLPIPARGAEPDPLLPAGADTVVVVNVKQVLDSGLVKKFALDQLRQILDGRDVKQILTDVGLDPLKDIDAVVVATVDTSRDSTRFLAVARGTFDPKKLQKTAEEKAKEYPKEFSVSKEGAATVFRFEPEGAAPVFAAVVDDKRVVVSNEKKLVTAAVAAAARPVAVGKELAALLAAADDKASVYAASVLKGKLDEVTLPESLLGVKFDVFEKLLPKLDGVILGVRVGADVGATATLRMADEKAAADMRTAVEDFLKQVKPLVELAGLGDARYKPLVDVLGTVKASVKGKDVLLTGAVTGDQIAKILNPGN